jgi:hypothetical protein
VTAALVDGLLQVRDRLGFDCLPYQPSALEIALHCGRSVWRTDDEGRRQLARIRDTLAAPADRQAFDEAVSGLAPAGLPPRMTCTDEGQAGPFLVLDTRPLGVRTIAGAATAAAAALATTELTNCVRADGESLVPSGPVLKRLERGLRRGIRGWWQTAFRPAT